MLKLVNPILLFLALVVLAPLSTYIYMEVRPRRSFIATYDSNFEDFKGRIYKTVEKRLNELEALDDSRKHKIRRYKRDLIDVIALDAFNNCDCAVKRAPVNDRIVAKALKNMRYLEEDFIKLRDFKLNRIPVGALKLLPNLTSLDLINTGTYGGVEGMWELERLETLNLCSNALRRIPNFSKFRSLRVVYLDANPIEIPDIRKVKGNMNIQLITLMKIPGMSRYENALKERFGGVEL